jgi:hypothetical protein
MRRGDTCVLATYDRCLAQITSIVGTSQARASCLDTRICTP